MYRQLRQYVKLPQHVVLDEVLFRIRHIEDIADANQISAAITTRFYEKETGIERFRATIGQILYFEDREVKIYTTKLNNELVTATAEEINGISDFEKNL